MKTLTSEQQEAVQTVQTLKDACVASGVEIVKALRKFGELAAANDHKEAEARPFGILETIDVVEKLMGRAMRHRERCVLANAMMDRWNLADAAQVVEDVQPADDEWAPCVRQIVKYTDPADAHTVLAHLNAATAEQLDGALEYLGGMTAGMHPKATLERKQILLRMVTDDIEQTMGRPLSRMERATVGYAAMNRWDLTS